MAAQVNNEIDYRKMSNQSYAPLPTGEVLVPDGVIYGQAEVITEPGVKPVLKST
jgi:hypothetical protein